MFDSAIDICLDARTFNMRTDLIYDILYLSLTFYFSDRDLIHQIIIYIRL